MNYIYRLQVRHNISNGRELYHDHDMGRGAQTSEASGKMLLYGSRRGGQRPVSPTKPIIIPPLSAEQLLDIERERTDLDTVLTRLWLVSEGVTDGSNVSNDLDLACQVLTEIGQRHQLRGEFYGVFQQHEYAIVWYRRPDGREVDTPITNEFRPQDLAADIIRIRDDEISQPSLIQV